MSSCETMEFDSTILAVLKELTATTNKRLRFTVIEDQKAAFSIFTPHDLRQS